MAKKTRELIPVYATGSVLAENDVSAALSRSSDSRIFLSRPLPTPSGSGLVWIVLGYSGGTVPDFHRFPF
jgi:hypothetical protein